MTSYLPAAALALCVLLGALTQRITGMGFALVASPFLVLLLGARTGVPLVQVLSMTASVVMLFAVFREVEWRKAVALMLPAAAGIVPGWWVSEHMPGPWLSILVGTLVLLALVAMLLDERARVFKGTGGLVGAGLLSGFMNVTAAVGGPAIVLYRLSTGWPHRSFVATVQVYFVALNIGSLIAHGGLPDLHRWEWLAAFAALGAGIVGGELLSRRIDARRAGHLVVAVALAGSLATIVRGIFDLV